MGEDKEWEHKNLLKCDRYICRRCGKSMIIEAAGVRHWDCMECGTINYEENYLELRIGKQLEQKAREEGGKDMFSQEELNILMWLIKDRKQGLDWNYRRGRISEWEKVVSDGLFNKLEVLSKLKTNK